MKKMLLAGLVTLMGSAALADVVFECKNEGFTNLAIQLVSSKEISVKVLAGGTRSSNLPSAGEGAILKIDQEVSSGEMLVMRSEVNQQTRTFEMSFPKRNLIGQSPFRASLRVSGPIYHSVLTNYDMVCSRN